MISVAATLGHNLIDHPLKKSFLRWQCLTRQVMMRDNMGRPDDAITPAVVLAGSTEPLGHIITILNKAAGHSVVPEMQHMLRKTNDPAQVRDAALQFLSETYYQKPAEFSDILTSTFPPGSQGAATIRGADRCVLLFAAYGQTWELDCKVWRLIAPNPLYEATLTHNRLFNPALPDETIVLGFEPDWDKSKNSA
ncbi:MAG: hypothetical protein JKY94_13770 [Rhodobacteraceae bacterium]|nr:hypothetical protein [Paracoccaceae bacterium]